MRAFRLLPLIGFMLCCVTIEAQETFSIVAVDTNTGKIGSAGASCLDSRIVQGGASIISSVIPGRGAIHTQAVYRKANQDNAEQRLKEGLSADSIISWLVANDARLAAESRQYGIALLKEDNKPQTAAFTGSNTDSFKGQRVGRNYAIQGNILKGPVVLDTMKRAFLETNGPIAKRLMAALKAAAFPGADRRCLEEGVSSQSAFLRVADPNDSRQNLSIDLVVPQTPEGVEPIDSLQELYIERLTHANTPNTNPKIQVSQSLKQDQMSIELPARWVAHNPCQLQLWSPSGSLAGEWSLTQRTQNINLHLLSKGLYIYHIEDQAGHTKTTGKVMHW
jgi:uncharacterized Ntn-hydrolase superfamily protein